ACAKEIDSSVRFHDDYGELKTQPVNDQAGLAKAIEDTGFNPFILPLNWNFRPKWHRSFVGPIKIWHDYADPTDELIEHSKANHDARVMNVVYCHDEDESE